MRVWGYIFAAFVSLALFVGCGGDAAIDGDGTGRDAAVERLCEQFAAYTFVEDCLNGYYIVSGGLGEGVVDAAGGVVVPVSCERLYFIEDDVIAGFAGGNWRFFSTAGDVVTEASGAADDVPEMLLEKYEAARRVQDAVWEGIVSGYERFSGKCAAEGADFGNMKMIADSLRAEISRAEGRMSEGQRRRVEQAWREYREAGE